MAFGKYLLVCNLFTVNKKKKKMMINTEIHEFLRFDIFQHHTLFNKKYL